MDLKFSIGNDFPLKYLIGIQNLGKKWQQKPLTHRSKCQILHDLETKKMLPQNGFRTRDPAFKRQIISHSAIVAVGSDNLSYL
jgi:hypothetical protein